MGLENTGLELTYRSDYKDEDHIETSFIIYKSEYEDIQVIYRYTDELSEERKIEREKDLERTFHPPKVKILLRKMRNTVNTAKDAIIDVLNLVIGQVKKVGTGSSIIESDIGSKYVTKVGTEFVGYVGTSFDPILENCIGGKMVLEILEEEKVTEYVGVLKEYSSDFLEVLDVKSPQDCSFKIKSSERKCEKGNVSVIIEDKTLKIHNSSSQPVLLNGIKASDYEQDIDAVIDKGEELSYKLERDFPELEISLRIVREADIIVPRSHALIRHRAERYDAREFF